MFLGRGEVILKLEQLYHNAVLYFLEKKIDEFGPASPVFNLQ